MRMRHAIPAGVLGVTLSVAVATGCGVQSNQTGPDRTTAVTATTTSTTKAPAKLPTRADGTIAVNTIIGDPITGSAISDYTAQSSNNVVQVKGPDTNNFAALCAGRVDAITTTREPTAAEEAACKRNAVELAAPMAIGSDAIVLATKNQSDVGGDCITVRQARDIFKAGSTYINWNQLGFDNLPLRTTGREAGSAGFRLFGQIVLGEPDPTAGDVRADYLPRLSDATERFTVTGAAVRAAARARIRAHVKQITPSLKRRRKAYVDRAVAQANARALKVIAKVNAENKRKKIVVNGPALIRHNARFVAQVKSTAAIRAGRRFDAVAAKELAAYSARALRGTGQRGFIGPFNYSYYGVFEEQLRPMEIDFGVPETQSGQPVQYQDLSAADQAALAPAIARATGQTTPNPAAARTSTVTTKVTTNANAATVTVKSNEPVPAFVIAPNTIVPALNNLPATTKDGQAIYAGPNCVFPSNLTITNGAYPLTRRVFIYTTKTALKRPEVRSFLTFVIDNAQELAASVNLVPITDIQKEQALAIIAGKTAPKASSLNGGEATITVTKTTAGTSTVTGQATRTVTTPTTTTSTTPSTGGGGVPGVSSRGG